MTMTPSTLVAKTCESVTASKGGESMMIISYICAASSKNFSNCFEASNSDGFGGTGPLEIIFKLSTSLDVATLLNDKPSTSALLKPAKLSSLNVKCIVGFLMSASINNVLMPCCAYSIAKFAAFIDFPALGSYDVTNNVFIFLSIEENWIFVLIVLYCSVIGDFGLIFVIKWRPLVVVWFFFFLNILCATPF